MPEWLKKGNVKAEKGITIACGYCKKGKIHIEVKNGNDLLR